MAKAYVLFSGGIDSATTLALAASIHGKDKVVACSMDYGQKHAVEMQYARKFAAKYARDHRVIPLGDIKGSPLTDGNLADIPDVTYDQIQGVSPSYVPFRNGLMIAKLTSIAAADPEAEALFIGTHAEDALGMAYPDCTLMFIGAMAAAVYIGSYHKLQLYAPYIQSMKWQIVRDGARLGVDYRDTWSCYRGGEEHCGACPTCYARKESFRLAGIGDPTIYAA